MKCDFCGKEMLESKIDCFFCADLIMRRNKDCLCDENNQLIEVSCINEDCEDYEIDERE